MHQTQPQTYYLYRYESISGSWDHMKLDSPVSRPLLEAMNAILLKDGILAFIGTKSEFGQYLTELRNRREADSMGSWSSLPGSTILATLGWCLNPSTAEGRSLVFHGSPRVRALAYLIDLKRNGPPDLIEKVLDDWGTRNSSTRLDVDKLTEVGVFSSTYLSANEVSDAYADFIYALDLQVKAEEQAASDLFKRAN